MRTALLPFLFIFNTELLLIDVGPFKAIFVFVVAVVAMLLFAAATQGYFIAKSRIWETAALLLVAFTLFRPGFWLDQVSPPYLEKPGTDILQLAEAQPPGEPLRLEIQGPDFDNIDQMTQITVMAPLANEGDGAARLDASGLMILEEDGMAKLEEPMAGTPFFTTLQMFDFYADEPVRISKVELPAERMPKEVFYLPALLLLAGIVWLQRRRQTQPAFWGK
ncbi:MAG: DUF3394 domain-containing protein [Thiolinea sp.]